MKNKLILIFLSLTLLTLMMVGCRGANTASENNSAGEANNSNPYLSKETEKKPEDKNPIATIEMEDGKTIKIELYPEVAPNTVRNFISLANNDFYNGTIFHRVIKGFMIQGGDPEGTGMGGPDYSIFGEFNNNKFENNIDHKRGVISMARAKDKNSAGSQFFIMHEDSPHLNGDYAAFGNVIEGMDVVDAIATAKTDSKDKPKTDIKIKKITIDTFGVEYKEPVKYSK